MNGSSNGKHLDTCGTAHWMGRSLVFLIVGGMTLLGFAVWMKADSATITVLAGVLTTIGSSVASGLAGISPAGRGREHDAPSGTPADPIATTVNQPPDNPVPVVSDPTPPDRTNSSEGE
jgi:hypothetical protein